jgi:ABC-type branched-subunit amino acid transport system substrate-binding protein
VRAPYQREAQRAVEHLAATGVTRIAVAYTDDSFGADCSIGAMRGFDKARLRAAFVMKFKREKPDFAPIVAGVNKLDIQALLLIGSAQSVADGTRELRLKGSKATVVTMSNNASSGFIKLLGEHGRGTIVTQVFPSERALAIPMVKEAYTLAQAKGIAALTPAMLEGFAGAKVLVEGLKRAGRNPTRQKLRDALEGMDHLNIGGMELHYSPTDHGGLEYADLSIVGPDGRFQR